MPRLAYVGISSSANCPRYKPTALQPGNGAILKSPAPTWCSSMLIRFLFALIPLVFAAGAPTRTPHHYAYTGTDPALWTRSVLNSRDAATPGDFNVFPCGAPYCTVARVVTDDARNIYAVGSRTFAASSSASDVFVAKLDSAGATIFVATFSGKGMDTGSAIAVDPEGNIYAGGYTSSLNFPLRNAIQTAPNSGSYPGSGFLLKLSPDGSQLIYSTYFGGPVKALAADSSGNVYATGQTGWSGFPVTPGMPNGPIDSNLLTGVFGAFVAKLNATGDKFLYSGRISGVTRGCTGGSSCFVSPRFTWGVAIALDAAGNAYVAGNANVTDLPTTPGVLSPSGIGAWVARINASGSKLDYLTYLGTAKYPTGPNAFPGNLVNDLAVDAAGNAYLAGRTSDPQFPATAGAFQSKYDGPSEPPPYPEPPTDAFVAKLNPQGTAMVYATFLGGSSDDLATAIAIDSSGAAYVTGTTKSSDFPLTAGPAQGSDFVTAMNPAGSALTLSARFHDSTVSAAIAVDAGGRLRVAGAAGVISSLSTNAPLATRVFGVDDAAQGTPGAAVAPGEVVSLFGTGLGPAGGVSGQAGSTGQLPVTLAGTQVLFDGVAAPLLYVSQTQVNAVTPYALTPGKSTRVQVVAGTAASPVFQGIVVSSQPAIFANGASSASLNQDGTPNSVSNPAKLGSIVTVWATGAGPVYPTPADGEVATAAQNYFCCFVLVNNDEYAEVLYAGAAPGMVAGVVQINFRLPADLMLYGNEVGIGLSTGMSPSSPSSGLTTNLYVTP